MGEAELERVLLGFMRHEYDVSCPLPSSKRLGYSAGETMIIDHADGRPIGAVSCEGASDGRIDGLCVFAGSADTQLSEIAASAWLPLREFSDLGAGFRSPH